MSTGKRALSGIVAAGVVLGVGELIAVPIGPNSSPLTAVGSSAVDHSPAPIREWAIDTFGTSDKLALFVGMAVVIGAIAAAAGIARKPIGAVVFAALGVVGVLAAATRPDATAFYAVPTIGGVVVGIVVLHALIGAAAPATEGMNRRSFLTLAAGAAVLGVVAGTAGRMLTSARAVTADRLGFMLPTPTPQPPIPAGADLKIDGLASYITPNDDFYRIDTALVVPRVASDTWSLRIHGMVDREIELTFADLAQRQAVEKTVTLTCVSNIVGGDLVGNATWIGYPLKDILEEAGISPDADMALSSSSDAFTAGTPLEVLLDGRDALLAVGMNGAPLPVEHGYPARLVVPRSVRIRLGDQVGHRHRDHPIRQRDGILDRPRLGRTRTDQDGLANRHSTIGQFRARRADRDRGRRLGPTHRHRRRGSASGRGQLGADNTVGGVLQGHLAAMDCRTRPTRRPTLDPSARHQLRRRATDQPDRRHRSRRCHRLPANLGDGELI